MRIRLLVLTILLVALPWPLAGQDLFLTNGRIVDPRSETVVQGNLLIEGGVIRGMPAEAPQSFRGDTVDLRGLWVIPGLNDLHTHSALNQAPGGAVQRVGTPAVAKLMLYTGVTGFLDLFSSEEEILSLRGRQRGGGVPGADIFAAGPCFTATDGHCSVYGVPTRLINTPDEARREVNELARKRPDVVKVVYAPDGRMPSVDLVTLEAAITAAAENDIKTVIHVSDWDHAREAVLAGASALTHTPGPDTIPHDLVDLMREHEVFSIPTLTVHTELTVLLDNPDLLDAPLPKAVTTPEIREAYRTGEVPARWLETERRTTSARLASVKRMADGGVRILTGTDAGNWGVIQGYSVHRELVKLVEAGLTPWQGLAASTTEAGDFLGRSFGLQEGDEANLVVLEASPLADIRNTQRIVMVIHHGRMVERELLLNE